MKRALITGGAGFIGFHLTNFLKQKNWQVISIDNFFHPCKAKSQAKYADVRYFEEIEPLVKQADCVFHLAAQIHVDRSIENPQETFDINVKGTLNIIEACKKHDKKLIFASSSEVYGTAQSKKINETHPLDGHSPYAASKTAGDRLCYAYHKTYGLNVAILRNFNTFGPYQKDDSYGGVIAIFVRNALLGKPLTIFGNGKQERDYMWINDVMQGYDICIQHHLHGQPLNIGSGKSISINELARLIKKLTRSKSAIVHNPPRSGEVQRLCADIAFAKKFGFSPLTDFEKNLTQYIKWYKNQN